METGSSVLCGFSYPCVLIEEDAVVRISLHISDMSIYIFIEEILHQKLEMNCVFVCAVIKRAPLGFELGICANYYVILAVFKTHFTVYLLTRICTLAVSNVFLSPVYSLYPVLLPLEN
jgi:hypothetical protein